MLLRKIAACCRFPPFVMQDVPAALLTAFAAALMFFYPMLDDRGWYALYAIRGDGWHASVAGFFAVKHFLYQWAFSGVDFFTHGGASEYFLRPNYPTYYPVLFLFMPFLQADDPASLTEVYVWYQALHAFFSVYFLHRLCRRFLKFDVWLSVFVAVGYSFSMQVVQGLWFLPLVTCVWLLPVCLYAVLAYAARPGLPMLLIASLPAFLAYTAGYFPTALAVMALTALGGMGWHFLTHRAGTPWSRFWQAARTLMPLLLASAVVAPYYYAAAVFHQDTEITISPYTSSIVPVAYELADSGRYLLRGLVNTLGFPGELYEFYVFWGLVPLLVFLLYIVRLPATPELALGQARHDRVLLQVCVVLYGVTLLTIFGRESPFSTLFYYFAPVLGKMHIYQRYMAFMHLFFILAIAVMLRAVVQERPIWAVKIMLGAMVVLLTLATQWAGAPIAQSHNVSSAVAVELLFAVLFLIALLLLGRRGAIAAATLFCFAVSLSGMYGYANSARSLAGLAHARQLALNRGSALALAGWLRAHSDKPIIKYIDITPGMHNHISKNMPWFMLQDVKLAGYYGYETHLGADRGLRKLMAIAPMEGSRELLMRPDWDWLRKTGAAFVLFEEGHAGNDPRLKDYADLSDKAVYRFTGENGNSKDNNATMTYVVAPLKFEQPAGIVFDNAYIRVTGASGTVVSDFKTNDANRMTFTVKGTQSAVVQYLFWPGKHWHVQVDGKRVEAALVDGLLTIPVAPGAHAVRILYQNGWLSLFVVFYTLYAGAFLLLAGLAAGRPAARWRGRFLPRLTAG